jgi:hypothetical protein
MSLLILFSTFTGSRPATLLTGDSSSSNDSQEGSADDLSSTTLVNYSDGDTLVGGESDSKTQMAPALAMIVDCQRRTKLAYSPRAVDQPE